ncbi:MAG TPA: 4'-phosphopantetheinyl transferase superfamily protein [Pyrinomonadaceae bacterium]|nr:4'-phosphopantetheinyl transferase superfamily protein [Pyrinomonadaceae bacterium]
MTKYLSEDPAGYIPVALNDGAVTLPLSLLADEVHVWLARLDDHPADSLKVLLAADELARAARFHFDRDRNHFIVARALLRKLLAAYLDVGAGELQISYAEKGKPSLEDSRRTALKFNLAHSHELAIYAFSWNREVGIDLEFMREDLADEKVADRFFSQSEIKNLRKLPAELRKQAFFDCWTRKEAYIKARGEGLSIPLDEFDVSLQPGEVAALLRNHKDPGEVARWSMQSVAVPAGYVGALVVSGHDWKLKSFNLISSDK